MILKHYDIKWTNFNEMLYDKEKDENNEEENKDEE